MIKATATTCPTSAPATGGRYLTVKEVADQRGVGVHTVLCWIRSGELKGTDSSAFGKVNGFLREVTHWNALT